MSDRRHGTLLAKVCLVMAAGLFAEAQASAEEVSGIPSLFDGDTLEIAKIRIRLHGIDALETGRQCRQNGRPAEATIDRLANLSAQGLSCSASQHDAYGRLIAVLLWPKPSTPPQSNPRSSAT